MAYGGWALNAGCNYVVYFPRRPYFILALYLERKERAGEVVRGAYMGESWHFELHQLLDAPQLYEILAVADTQLFTVLEDRQLVFAEEKLFSELNTKIEKNWKPPLHEFPMAELLRHFPAAAFFVHQDE
jgi:hypothetical protein